MPCACSGAPAEDCQPPPPLPAKPRHCAPVQGGTDRERQGPGGCEARSTHLLELRQLLVVGLVHDFDGDILNPISHRLVYLRTPFPPNLAVDGGPFAFKGPMSAWKIASVAYTTELNIQEIIGIQMHDALRGLRCTSYMGVLHPTNTANKDL